MEPDLAPHAAPPAAAPSYPLFPCPGTKARPAFTATPQCWPAPSSGQNSPPLSTPHPSRHQHQVSVHSRKLGSLGGGCPGIFSSWSPLPAENRGVRRQVGSGVSLVPSTSSHSLTCQSQPGPKAGSSPRPARGRRGALSGRGRGVGRRPALTSSGAASGGPGPRVFEARSGGQRDRSRVSAVAARRVAAGTAGGGVEEGGSGEELGSRPPQRVGF